MTKRNTLIVAGVSIVTILLLLAVKHFMAQPDSVTKEKEVTEISRDKDTHRHTETVIVEEPGGKKTTTIVTDENTETKTRKDTSRQTQVQVESKKSTINISALAGVNIREPSIPVYGISVSKELIGPVTVGAFGFSNGLVGMSVGINF